MLSSTQFIKQSLALHLFFVRIMKEHSLFLEASFVPKNHNLAVRADSFKKQFDALLADVIRISNGVVSRGVLASGEVVTPYTLTTERISSRLTGIPISFNLTQMELALKGNNNPINNPRLDAMVSTLNQRAANLTRELINFKTYILSEVLACRIVTNNYPTMIHHIREEATHYLKMIVMLQERKEISTRKEILDEEIFWDDIMHEHSEFIRGLLDPEEEKLMKTADDFAHEFQDIIDEAKRELQTNTSILGITNKTIVAVTDLRNFKVQGVQGLIACKIKSLILPLLADHVTREANHYLRELNEFKDMGNL